MYKDWPNKEHDIETAESIMEKYLDFNDGEPIGVFEVALVDDKVIDCNISPWVFEVLETFSEKYGDDEGYHVTQKIVSHCLINDETVH